VRFDRKILLIGPAVGIDVEEKKRNASLTARRDLLILLSSIALVCCGVLALGMRTEPREHWPG